MAGAGGRTFDIGQGTDVAKSIKSGTFGPRRQGRTFNRDLMKGESTFKNGGNPYGHREATPKRNRKANAQPAGGGGGGWAKTNEQMARNRADLLAQAGHDGESAGQTGTSIFDPVLCELAYRWFCPPGGQVLDPFAGGSVRGIVASKLGRQYLGIDLRPEQVAANADQARRICSKPMPRWLVGDAIDTDKLAGKVHADFVFSCPPYADLEVYSDDPRDLSTMDYPDFRAAYGEIIAKACARLRPDRFAAFVVGDARDARGLYYGLPWHTVEAFERAGMRLYNEAVLVTAAGSLPIRAGKQFETSRKLGKTHQNVLVFVKGDPVKATQAIGEVEFGEVADVDSAPLAAAAPVLGGEV